MFESSESVCTIENCVFASMAAVDAVVILGGWKMRGKRKPKKHHLNYFMFPNWHFLSARLEFILLEGAVRQWGTTIDGFLIRSLRSCGR